MEHRSRLGERGGAFTPGLLAGFLYALTVFIFARFGWDLLMIPPFILAVVLTMAGREADKL